MLLCVACSATLSEGSSSVPNHSEKETLPVHFDCGHSVCGSCIIKRRRLAQACIMCESVHDVLTGNKRSSSSKSKESLVAKPRDRSPPSYTDQPTDDFILGDDSDNEEGSTVTPNEDELPAYNDEESSRARSELTTGMDEKREQCSLHYIKPDDTLLGLALHYKIDPPTLAKMNKLPISTLSTTPHLLHTLPFILLPPSVSTTSAEPLLPPAEERKRLLIRRFQMQTRCTDWSLAKAYVDQVYDTRRKEMELIAENRRLRGDAESLEIREGGELEEALESWRKDELWEEQQKGKGKAAVMGSKMKSTGQVEAKVNGWKWPRSR